MNLTARERQWHQIVPASGMSADFINHPMSRLDPLWSIRTRADDTPRLRDEVQKRLESLETYTEYAKRQQEFKIYVNEGNKEKVARVDRLVREIKAESKKTLESINLVLLLEKAQAIQEIIFGKEIQIGLITELRRLGY